MKDDIKKLVLKAVRDCGEIDDNAQMATAAEDTCLFGDGGTLDSAGLVFLVAEIEEAMQEQLGISVSLVSESAFGRKSSPFRTVQTLAEYVAELVKKCPA